MENNLENDVKRAKALGLSYGQYKALHYDPDAPLFEAKKPKNVCIRCGEEVIPPKLKFCSDECAKAQARECRQKSSRKHYLLKVKKM
jgi:predicted nucleic acid-binding Zn ribbon protein